jgi:hypothetical protein
MLLKKPGKRTALGADSEPGQGWGPGSTVSPPRCPGLRSALGNGRHTDIRSGPLLRACPGIPQVSGLCDHEGVPRGTASKQRTRYTVRLTVPRRSGWRAWGTVRPDFERALTDQADPAIASAEITSELRRGSDYVRVTAAFTVLAADVAGALTIAWDAFRSAAGDDLSGWDVAAATAEVRPGAPLSRAGSHSERRCMVVGSHVIWPARRRPRTGPARSPA